MQAARYDEQQALNQCGMSAQTEQRLSMIVAHCRELQLEFRELKELAERVYCGIQGKDGILLTFCSSIMQTRLERIEKALT